MNKILILATTMMVVLLCRWGFSQQTAGYPAWMNLPTNSGAPFTPPEYTGSFVEKIGIQFHTRKTLVGTTNAIVFKSTSSGVLAIADHRTSTLSRLSWDTGLTRVHSLRRIGKRSDQPARLLVTGWDGSANVCRVMIVTIPATGVITQTVLAPTSATNGIWTEASPVDGVVYLYDVQNATVRRLIDSNQDGTIDTLDASFVVPIPQDSVTNPIAATLFTIRGFSRNPEGKISIWNNRTNSVFIEDSGGVPPYLSNSVLPESLYARLGGDMTSGQRSVFVYGTPGVEFTVKKRGADGELTAISKKWTIPNSQRVVVDLFSPLVLNDKVVVIPTDFESVGASFEWTVSSTHPAILFEIFVSRRIEQGKTIRLRGDKFLPSYKVHFKTDSLSGVLATSFVDSGNFDVTMPVTGSPTAVPPYTKSTAALVWLVDSSTGQVVSNARPFRILHD